MKDLTSPDVYGTLIEATTLKIERLLPGPIERVWSYLINSELRRQWLAAGDMQMQFDSSFELVWRNDELSSPPSQRPAGFSEEHRMQCRITELDPPHKLSFTWSGSGDVCFELEAKAGKVLLTVTHHRLPNRATLLQVAAGWHMHLDILFAIATDTKHGPFWEGWSLLQKEYDQRLPG
jgi:uncharacterized protein YndB with AHSA1/START domain